MSMKQWIRTSALLLAIPMVSAACKTVKEETDNGSAPTEVKRTVGTVRTTEDCGYYIEVIVGDVAHSFSPVNLDSRFQVDGMRLKFAFEKAAVKPPHDCPNFEPVSLNDVTPLR